MSVLGPMVVVAEEPAGALIDVLSDAGAFPIIEASWRDTTAAVAEIGPAALAIASPAPAGLDVGIIADVLDAGARYGVAPFLPIFARTTGDDATFLPGTLPVDATEPAERIVGRIRAALRVRALHAAVMRRAEAAGHAPPAAPDIWGDEMMDDAAVLCIGRGRTYPALAVAVGERVNVVGALSIEAAAQSLNTRDLDGIVIGDGFSARIVEALLIALSEDARFRDMPIAVHGKGSAGLVDDALPNLIRLDEEPLHLVRHLLPYVRLQAFEAQLKRLLKSLDAEGLVDPSTGLRRRDAFWQELDRIAAEAADCGGSLSVARITFGSMIGPRSALDAARLLSRLVRDVDTACQDADGAMLVAFTNTDLRAAHVVARRLAATLRQNVVIPGGRRREIAPTVTLATLKPTDTVETMMTRISALPMAAAAE